MQPRSKILAVDDNPTNLSILQEILSEDYELRTASSAEEALQVLESFRPSLILLDIMMPGMDGYELCRRIRAQSKLRYAKIIMVSAKAMVQERLEGYEAGADDYITKPFDEDELLSKVKVFLRLKSVEEVDQLKSDMLSLLSSEVRTPLKSLLVPAEILKGDGAMNEGQRKRLGELLHRNAKRLQTFFDRVLTLSALRAGSWKFDMSVSSLGGIVEEAIRRVSSRAAERQVEIRSELAPEAKAVADPREMQNVFEAVIDNAVRFSPEKGTVNVKVAVEDGCIACSVTDQGKGISEKALPRVFEEFAEIETPDDDVEGYETRLGLSLALARQVVEHHGGEITAKSLEGVRTTFTVRLPLARNAGSREAEVREKQPQAQSAS